MIVRFYIGGIYVMSLTLHEILVVFLVCSIVSVLVIDRIARSCIVRRYVRKCVRKWKKLGKVK